MLELTSPEWSTIKASPGGNGLLTAQLLAKLADGDESAWPELYQQVCHQSTVGEVAFVAAPHLVAIARTASPRLRTMLLATLGSIVASRKCYPIAAAELRIEWSAEYTQACVDALLLVADALKDGRLAAEESVQLIGALAAFHGHSNLALLLEDGPEFWCPECGEPIAYGPAEE